jgi:hypothetical protein
MRGHRNQQSRSSVEGHITPYGFFLGAFWLPRYILTLLVSGSNVAKQATLTALLDPSAHCRPPLTHTSHHRLTLVDLEQPFQSLSDPHRQPF